MELFALSQKYLCSTMRVFTLQFNQQIFVGHHPLCPPPVLKASHCQIILFLSFFSFCFMVNCLLQVFSVSIPELSSSNTLTFSDYLLLSPQPVWIFRWLPFTLLLPLRPDCAPLTYHFIVSVLSIIWKVQCCLKL